MRSDTERNRRQIIRAGAELFAAPAGRVTMAEIAKHAEVSTATAYRHFTSVDEILAAFRSEVGSQLREFSVQQDSHGLELLEAVSREWVSLVLHHGGAMVQTRSHRGYLARLREGTEYLIDQAEALRDPLREATQALGLPDLGDEAMFLWNLLFDPREILDLVTTVGLTEDQVVVQLLATLRGALVGWSEGRQVRALPRAQRPTRAKRPAS